MAKIDSSDDPPHLAKPPEHIPAHIATVTVSSPAPRAATRTEIDPAATAPMSPLEVDLLNDPALD